MNFVLPSPGKGATPGLGFPGFSCRSLPMIYGVGRKDHAASASSSFSSTSSPSSDLFYRVHPEYSRRLVNTRDEDTGPARPPACRRIYRYFSAPVTSRLPRRRHCSADRASTARLSVKSKRPGSTRSSDSLSRSCSGPGNGRGRSSAFTEVSRNERG